MAVKTLAGSAAASGPRGSEEKIECPSLIECAGKAVRTTTQKSAATQAIAQSKGKGKERRPRVKWQAETNCDEAD